MSTQRPPGRHPAALPRVLSAIASTLDSVEEVGARIGRVLELLRSIVPYDQAALLQLQDGAPGVLVAQPAPPATSLDPLTARLNRLAELLVDPSQAGTAKHRAPGTPNRLAATERSHLAVPTVGLDEVMGILFVERAGPDAYDEESIAALSVVAAEIGTYLTTVRLVAKQAEVTRELARALDFQQLLVGIVSHDLRNPLTVISLLATAHRERSKDERLRHGLDRIFSSATRANHIIRDLLDTTQARLGSGIPVERAPMELDALLRSSVDEMLVAHPKRHVVYESTGRVEGSGDRARLAQVLGNLLTNALHYSEPDTEVRVRLRVSHNAAEIEVQNQGPVIPAHLLPVLFDPFRRGPAQEKTGVAGLGLGLYIVHEIVKRHEGRVEVRSTEADGTAFTVILPCFAASELEAEAPEEKPPVVGRPASDRPAEAKDRILVVDDDEDVREVLADIVRAQGYEVFCAPNGLAALTSMRESAKPHVVLLDLMMPAMDGFTLLGEMKKDPLLADIPVIVISAEPDPFTVPGGEYLAKPVEVKTLLASIQRHCGRG